VVAEAGQWKTRNGLAPDGEGWFVLNARASRWRDGGPLGVYCTFEGKRHFPQLGITLNVLQPGQPMGMYHRENGQEGFLVVAGECRLIVEGTERRLVAWDFFHCPPRTAHIIVGSGSAPAVVVAVGARGRGIGGGVVYEACAAAARYGAAVERETRDAREAYAKAYSSLPRSRWIAYRSGWLPDG
jgi:quercetin dioxygenase-like cupin family protein